jgi:hypothetical protein
MYEESYKDVFRKKLNEKTGWKMRSLDWDMETPIAKPKPRKPPTNSTSPSRPDILFPFFGKPTLQPSSVDPITPLPPLQKPIIKPTKPTEV